MWLRPYELSVKIKLFFRLSGDEEQRCHGIHHGSSLSGVFSDRAGTSVHLSAQDFSSCQLEPKEGCVCT